MVRVDHLNPDSRGNKRCEVILLSPCHAFTPSLECFLVGLLVCFFAVSAFQRNSLWRDSITIWKDAEGKNAHTSRVYNNLGYEFLRQARYEDAIAMFTRALEREPRNDDDPYTRVSRGLAYQRTGQHGRAMADFDKAIALDRSISDAYYYRAREYDEAGDLDRAIGDYNMTLQLEPENIEARIDRGIALGKKGRMEEAIGDFDQALGLRPGNADAYNNRGVAREGLGQFDRALEDFNRAIEIDPGFSQAYGNRAHLFRRMERCREAVEDLTRLITLTPELAETYLERGDCYRKMGMRSFMLQDYHEACERGSDAGCKAARAHAR